MKHSEGYFLALEVFSGDNVRASLVEQYITCPNCPEWFQRLFLLHGLRVTLTIKKYLPLRWILRPLFEYFALRGTLWIYRISIEKIFPNEIDKELSQDYELQRDPT